EHADQVEIDHPSPGTLGLLQKRLPAGSTGIVDENIDAPELFVRLLDRGADLIRIADISGSRESIGAHFPHPSRSLLATFRDDIRDDYRGTDRGVGQSYCPANPAATTGDDRNLAGEKNIRTLHESPRLLYSQASSKRKGSQHRCLLQTRRRRARARGT